MSTTQPSLIDVNDWFNRSVKQIDETQTPELSNETGDYWQTPAETIMHLRGDCEDYAIAKMYTLIEYGYDASRWQIHAVRLNGDLHGQPGKTINHAFLVDTKYGWVLDNLVSEIVTLEARADVVETYAIISPNESNTYKQWNDMLFRRNPVLDSELIRSIFG